MLRLNNLTRNPGATQNRVRVGRGVGSGLGGTAGRGHKGQKSRKGKNTGLWDFEGGQMPFWRRVPKSGFSNRRTGLELQIVNLEDVQAKLAAGQLPADGEVTIKSLVDAGLVRASVGDGVKLLGQGRLSQPLAISVTRASRSAIAAVEAAGGSVVTTWMNRLGLRAHLKPEAFRVLPRPAAPPPKQLKYYTSDDTRGYLSLLVQRRKQPAHM